MKICNCCKKQLENCQFYYSPKMKLKLDNSCKKCRNEKNKLTSKARSKKYYDCHKNQQLLKAKAWTIKNKEKKYLSNAKFKERNPELIKKIKAKYRKENSDKINFWNCNRKQHIKKATPTWLSDFHKKQIQVFYKTAKDLKKERGINFQVDHIIPIRGKTVCGLHVPWNLQIITATENMSKNNRLLGEL